MKYMLMFIGNGADAPEGERDAMYARIGQWWSEHSAAGRIVGGDELRPATTARTVRSQGDDRVVTDGPFVESKEHIGGYAIVEVPDEKTAIEMAKTWPTGGTVEVRPLVEDH